MINHLYVETHFIMKILKDKIEQLEVVVLEFGHLVKIYFQKWGNMIE